jgi:hypothetical protein
MSRRPIGGLAADGRDEALLALGEIIDQRVGSEFRDRRLHVVRRLQLAGGGAAQIRGRDGGEQSQPHLADDRWRPLGVVGAFQAARLLTHPHVHAGLARRADRAQGVLARGVVDGVQIGPALIGLAHAPVGRGDRGIDLDFAREVPRAVHAEVHPEPDVSVEGEEHLLADSAHLDRFAAVDDRGALGEAALRTGCRDLASDDVSIELARCGVRSVPRASAGFGIHRVDGLATAGAGTPPAGREGDCRRARTPRAGRCGARGALPENGVAMKRSMKAMASSTVC